MKLSDEINKYFAEYSHLLLSTAPLCVFMYGNFCVAFLLVYLVLCIKN